MAYLTEDEYIGYMGTKDAPDNFDELLAKASDVVDGITYHYYEINNLDDDPVKLRSRLFKKAVAQEISYMLMTGWSSSADLAKIPASQTIGSTSVSMRSNGSSKSNELSLVADELYATLAPTGLLYRGVDYK